MQTVILAGGLGTRLGSLTQQIPKSLVPIAGRPFIEYQLELLASHGLKEIVIAAGYLGEQIEEHCAAGEKYGLHIQYSYDGAQLLGTAGALRQALPLLEQKFFVMYGDAYLPCEYRKIAAYFNATKATGLMTIYENHDQFDRSNVVIEGGRILVYDKEHYMPGMTFIDYGLSLFCRASLALLPPNNPQDLSVLHQVLIKKNRLVAYKMPTRFYEIGSTSGLQEFTSLITHGQLHQQTQAA